MRKIKLYIATSIDGYIATKSGGLDWFTDFPNPQQIDYGYEAFYETNGTVVNTQTFYNGVSVIEYKRNRQK